MGLDDLQEVIEKLQLVIKTYKADYLLGKERRTRQMLIDPLLKVFGWDVLDPSLVYLEHNKMDYALISDATPVAVIEAKALGESLEKKAITQAITYAVENTIPYIIVTNGDRWEMYEVFKQADLEDKKLMAFQLSEQSAQECALQALRLWKSNLASGRPAEAMEPVLDSPSVKAAKTSPGPDPKPEEGKKTRSRLTVTMPNGTVIARDIARDTFVEVIDQIGIQKVEELNLVCRKVPLISTSDNPQYKPRRLGKYYIMVFSSNKDKKRLLEKIAVGLGEALKVEIVPKD